MCLGKALGGGAMPIGALLGSERALGGFDDVPTGSTWAWLPASCAAALETLAIFEREPVLENVRELERARRGDASAELATASSAIGDVRAVGCFMAIEFVADRETKERAPELQDAVAAEACRRGAARRLEHHLAQRPALAGDAAADALERALRDPRRLDRGGRRRR